VRQILEEGVGQEPFLLITPNQVQFNVASDCWIDVVEFNNRLAACRAHHPSGLSLCAACQETLSAAIVLYRGSLLKGLTLPHCRQFAEWQTISQEATHHQALAALLLLADYFEAEREYGRLIACTQRMIELEPWLEEAHRRQMWALSMEGERERALKQYEILQDVLQREFGAQPVPSTRRLYERIRSDRHPRQPGWQEGAALHLAPAGDTPARPFATFAGRQSELAQLHGYLAEARAGRGRVAFVSGEAGSGKTALLGEFARQAMHEDGDLLVCGGRCSTYRGLGDCYQPFREVLEMLSGTTAPSFSGELTSREQEWRLASARPALMQVMHETCPGVMGSFLPGPDAVQQETVSGDSLSIQQTAPCDQVARVLLAVSDRFPLLILLDDLQWLDNASASLLFHLGSHLTGGRILHVGAYRPEDVDSAPGLARHPLAAILNEFHRRFGENEVNLDQAGGRAFTGAYLDGEPNQFDHQFRETLFRHTRGNALFTTELLRGMQARGEVVCGDDGTWLEGAPIDWEDLPARVEAVFAERLSRLDRGCLALLEAASVQGEIFSARTLADVLGVAREEVVLKLNQPLRKQHRLVSVLRRTDTGEPHRTRYRISCLLLQKYLYRSLGDAKRKHLQRATAAAENEAHPKSVMKRAQGPA
jgi:DNA-binding SARP family transcriptional activator